MKNILVALIYLVAMAGYAHAEFAAFTLPEPDKDGDGYADTGGGPNPPGWDCDDTNRLIYPGISVACKVSTDGDGWKTCKASGSYSSCTKSSVIPLCEGTRCFYYDPVNGSDQNSGSYSSPWKTFAKINSPSNTLTSGDVVYLKSGVYRDAHSIGGVGTRSIYFQGKSNISIKAYPGHKPVLTPSTTSCPINVHASTGILIDGIEIANAKIGTNCEGGILLTEGSGHEIRNSFLHGIDGSADNNNACIHLIATSNTRIHHNELADCYDAGHSNTRNNAVVVLFRGTGNRVDHNLLYYTNPASSATNVGLGIKYKHGQSGGTFEADHNILWNMRECALCSGQPNSNFHHNLVFDSWSTCKFVDWGGNTYHQSERCEYNTAVNTIGLYYDPSNTYGPISLLTFSNNVVSTNRSFTSQESGMDVVGVYLPDALYQDVVDGGKLAFSKNCYYNAGQAFDFELFTSKSQGALGQTYTWQGWKARGYDTSSYDVDPKLHAAYGATAEACKNAGWLAGRSGEVPDPGPEPDPVPPVEEAEPVPPVLSIGPAVITFLLINADTDKAILELKADSTIDMTRFPASNINIEAVANMGTAKVLFDYNGMANYRSESARPFALFGDNSGDYNGQKVVTGEMSVTATPIDSKGVKGPAVTRRVTFYQ